MLQQEVSLLIFLFLTTVMDAADISATVDEEVPVDTLVTRLREHPQVYMNLTPDQIPFMNYDILNSNTVPSNYFHVDRRTGDVSVARKMDREEICDPGVTCLVDLLIAIKAGQEAKVAFSNVISIQVVINDINDNPPRFPARDVTLEVSEGAKVGTELKISGAVDRDSKPEFIVQHYNTTPAIDTFSIWPTTNPDGSSTINLRLEKELDREMQDSYIFNIIAYDGGSNPQSDYLRVTVKVTDDNDNSPLFDSLKYELTVNENEPVGAVIGHVKATDKDIGAYGRITYNFSQTSDASIKGVFALNSSTGVISVKGDLRTIRRSVPLLMYVDARDGGDPPRSNQTLVSVYINSSGNNPPFVGVNTVTNGDASTLTVPESARQDYFVAFVDVKDNDEGDNGKVSCVLLSGPDFRLSSVPNKGYTLLLNREVDREKKDVYFVVISCKDKANPPLETKVNLTVNITDINDHTPKFSQNLYTASVDENREAGQYIAQVSAQDEDMGINADITYSVPKDMQQYIKVHPRTGVISTSTILDREKNATLQFRVLATDGGLPARTGLAEIYITLKDVNDNSPAFNSSKFSFFASEGTPNSTVIGTLTAFDADVGANGQFDFYYSGSTNGDVPLPFRVMKNGSIVVAGLLDRETKDQYAFTALVRDRGDIPRSSSVPVEIKLLDENDNNPVILFPATKNHTIVISNLPENGMVLGRIIAYDMDEGDAADLRYSIYEGNDEGAFSVGLTSGELILENMKGLHNPQDYYLFIKVQDASAVPRNATTQLRIEVNYENTSHAYANAQTGDSRDQYIIIVGVIGGATIILSVIIISAIIIILRSEKNRRGGGGNGSLFKNKFLGGQGIQQTVHSQKLVDSPDATKSQSNSSLGSDPSGLILSPGNLGKKHEEAPKKVSFSLQDDFHDQDHIHFPDKQLRLNLLPPSDNNHWRKLNNPDDLNSDTSGESGTCDSGRGTSDEDIKFDLSPNRGPQRPSDSFTSARDRSFDSFLPPNSRGHNSLSRHHTATPPLKPGQSRFLEMGGGRPEEGQVRLNYHGHRQPMSSSSSNMSSSLRQPSQQRGYSPYQAHNSNPDLLRPASAMSYTQPGSAMTAEDDASTTTSGSYVINHDDVRLDGLLGKDVIV